MAVVLYRLAVLAAWPASQGIRIGFPLWTTI